MQNCSSLNIGVFGVKAVSGIVREQPEDITVAELSEMTHSFRAKVRTSSSDWIDATIEILGNPSESLKKNVESHQEFELRLLRRPNNVFQVASDNMQ